MRVTCFHQLNFNLLMITSFLTCRWMLPPQEAGALLLLLPSVWLQVDWGLQMVMFRVDSLVISPWCVPSSSRFPFFKKNVFLIRSFSGCYLLDIFWIFQSFFAGQAAAGALTSILRFITKGAFESIHSGLHKGASMSHQIYTYVIFNFHV
jgi:hypothetical protein